MVLEIEGTFIFLMLYGDSAALLIVWLTFWANDACLVNFWFGVLAKFLAGGEVDLELEFYKEYLDYLVVDCNF